MKGLCTHGPKMYTNVPAASITERSSGPTPREEPNALATARAVEAKAVKSAAQSQSNGGT
jgi:hypothetical protein